MKENKIVLVGYMGSGKTTIGKMLSKHLNIKFLDLDTFIEFKEGLPISQIFKERGEVYFRKKEQQYLKELFSVENEFVLSVGGGTPCFGDNMEQILLATSNSIYIKASITELVNRLVHQKNGRPLIANLAVEELPDFIAKHLFERSFFYQKANLIIATDDKSPHDCVAEILGKLV